MTDTTALHNGHRKRLREKFACAGIDPFLDHEVLELLLTYVIARKDTKHIAWELLKKFGSLPAVLDASPEQLMQVSEIGPQAAYFLTFIRSVFKRYSMGKVKKKVGLSSPQEIIDYCKASLSGKQEEYLELIFLSVKQTVIRSQIFSNGEIDRIVISPRKIVECALLAKASSVILVHNHPSGDATPSGYDIKFTHETMRAAQLFNISIRDHIIVGKSKIYSFRANGYM